MSGTVQGSIAQLKGMLERMFFLSRLITNPSRLASQFGQTCLAEADWRTCRNDLLNATCINPCACVRKVMAVAFAYAQRMLDEGRVPASRTCLECFMHLYILYYNTYIYVCV